MYTKIYVLYTYDYIHVYMYGYVYVYICLLLYLICIRVEVPEKSGRIVNSRSECLEQDQCKGYWVFWVLRDTLKS